MSYVVLYVVFGVVFFTGILGYWVITRALRDPGEIYVEGPAPEAPSGSSPHLGKA